MVSKIAKIAPLLNPGFVFFSVGGCLKFEGARSGRIPVSCVCYPGPLWR